MQKLIPCLLLGLLAGISPVTAELCAIDAVPAATLLLPYFEVDLDDPNGVTTLFSINNAQGTPALAHVIFWTDWAYPTLSFDVYLTGYDVLSVNVRDIFQGNIPITADAPSDPEQTSTETVCGGKSPCGGLFTENRHWDDKDPEAEGEQGFPFCDQIFPGFVNPVIGGAALDRLHQGHTGQVFAPLDACLGSNQGDNVARGYITIDNVNQCSLTVDPAGTGFANTPYFSDGGLGVASNANQLWGDWSLVDPANGFAQSDHLVHIEAFDDLNAVDLPIIHKGTGTTVNTVAHDTRQTFYGRHFDDGRDNREPLGTTWAGRFLNGGSFDQSQLIIWRDPAIAEVTAIANSMEEAWCSNGPSWYPLDEAEVVIFDESENAVEVCDFPGLQDPPPDEDIICYPTATGRYYVGNDPLLIPFNFGWIHLNLNVPDSTMGDVEARLAQSHVTTMNSALGRYSVGLQAIEIHHACENFNEALNGAIENGGTNSIPFF